MSNDTLPAFDASEYALASVYLATTVATMMGRKFEEDDWSKVYCAAKHIAASTWSNLDIDVMSGRLGVEHKMICRPNNSLLELCGTSLMHPAGTRAIRVPQNESDATCAARDVLGQYARLIDNRSTIVALLNGFHHGRLSRKEAIAQLRAIGMSAKKASEVVPNVCTPVGDPLGKPDMRFGWLIWQRKLCEFLYFEEAMIAPIPEDFTAEWSERSAGRRRESKNLWVYETRTGRKAFSIKNDAGAKIQPYFTVPLPSDPNLYHFVVQGEVTPDGFVRIWLTESTARSLSQLAGGLSPQLIAKAVNVANLPAKTQEAVIDPFASLAVEVMVLKQTYDQLHGAFHSVSDEHLIRQLLGVLDS